MRKAICISPTQRFEVNQLYSYEVTMEFEDLYELGRPMPIKIETKKIYIVNGFHFSQYEFDKTFRKFI